MTESAPNLVTTYAFKGGKEFVTKMRVTAFRGGTQRNLELSVTDKYTSENWQSSYDSACSFTPISFDSGAYVIAAYL